VSGHSGRFTDGSCRTRANSYNPLSKADVSAQAANALAGAPYAAQIPQIQLAIGGLTFLDSTAEILPNETLRAFVVFSIPPQMSFADYERFMASTERLSFVIADLVTQTDDAGNPTTRTQFQIHFDRAMQNRQMMCPADAAPSLDRCSPNL
jgi:hypothetical protein